MNQSIEVYRKVEYYGIVRQHRMWVFEAIAKEEGLTDREYSQKIGDSDPGRFRRRRSELTRPGFVVRAGVRECTVTGRQVNTWKINVSWVQKWIDLEESTILKRRNSPKLGIDKSAQLYSEWSTLPCGC